MEKVSIIVPVYNVEQYLTKCIESLINQTYKNIEIILIDDGSTDNGGLICDEFSNKYSNIMVQHVVNGGLGKARNIGLTYATGNYIMFCDSDDCYDNDMVEYLYNAITSEDDIKIAMCGVKFVYSDKVVENLVYEEDFITDFDKLINMYFDENQILSSAVNKIYHKTVFESLKFPEGMIYEDRYLSLPMFLKYPRIYVRAKAKYNYQIREGSIVQSKFSNKNMDFLKIVEQELILLKDYPEFANKVAISYNSGIVMLLRKIIIDGYFKNKANYNLLLDKLKNNNQFFKDKIGKKSYKQFGKFYKYKYAVIFYYGLRNKVGRLLRSIKRIIGD